MIVMVLKQTDISDILIGGMFFTEDHHVTCGEFGGKGFGGNPSSGLRVPNCFVSGQGMARNPNE